MSRRGRWKEASEGEARCGKRGGQIGTTEGDVLGDPRYHVGYPVQALLPQSVTSLGTGRRLSCDAMLR